MKSGLLLSGWTRHGAYGMVSFIVDESSYENNIMHFLFQSFFAFHLPKFLLVFYVALIMTHLNIFSFIGIRFLQFNL